MTQQTDDARREQPRVRALLWTSGGDPDAPAAPSTYGGEPLDEQERAIKAHAKQHGVTLGVSDVFVTHVPAGTPPGDRLGQLVSFVSERPSDELYVPESVFADLGPTDVKMYIATLHIHGTDLIFCRHR